MKLGKLFIPRVQVNRYFPCWGLALAVTHYRREVRLYLHVGYRVETLRIYWL